MNAFCSSCGAPLASDAVFCSQCGHRTKKERIASTSLWLIGATVVAAVVAVVLTALAVWSQRSPGAVDSVASAVTPLPAISSAQSIGTATGSPAPDSPVSTTPSPATPDAPASLDELAEDGRRALGGVRDGTWVPQVSSKCSPLTSVDFEDADGRVGWADGVLEDFPDGMQDSDIVAFHQGLSTRVGGEEGNVVLVTGADLGLEGQSSVCGDATVWVSLLVSQQFSTSDDALEYCAATGLPWGECAARQIGPDTDFVLPATSADPDAPGTYPVLVDTYLSIRSGPSLEAREVGRVSAGGYVTIECVVEGDVVVDPFGDEITQWDRIRAPFNGYVSDAFVDTGGLPGVRPPC